MSWTSLVVQKAKNLPAMQEKLVQSLGWEDPLEKGMATPPVFFPGESHGQWSLVGYSSRVGKEPDSTEQLHFHFHFKQRPRRTVLYKVICVLSIQGSSSLRMSAHLSGCVSLA